MSPVIVIHAQTIEEVGFGYGGGVGDHDFSRQYIISDYHSYVVDNIVKHKSVAEFEDASAVRSTIGLKPKGEGQTIGSRRNRKRKL